MDILQLIGLAGTCTAFLFGVQMRLHFIGKVNTTHLDHCVDDVKNKVAAIQLTLAANYTKQDTDANWMRRDAQHELVVAAIGNQGSQLAVLSSQVAALMKSFDRLANQIKES